MIRYTSTPDYYRDVIQHGWIKDAAAKAHKYVERWRGKNGKWIYRYKSKAQELGTKVIRRFNYREPLDPSETTRNYGTSRGTYDNEKANSRSGERQAYTRNPRNGNFRSTTKLNAGIEAGRRRAAKKGYAVQGYRGKKGSNLSSRGYSNSNSPKGMTTITLKGRSYNIPEYDNITDVFGSVSKSRKKKNDESVSRGTKAGRARAIKKGYIKGERPKSRKKNILLTRDRNGQITRAKTNVKVDRDRTNDMYDNMHYKRLRNKVAAYNARKNRRAK